MILESPGQEINIKAFPGRTMQRQKVDRMAVVRGEQETGELFLGCGVVQGEKNSGNWLHYQVKALKVVKMVYFMSISPQFKKKKKCGSQLVTPWDTWQKQIATLLWGHTPPATPARQPAGCLSDLSRQSRSQKA